MKKFVICLLLIALNFSACANTCNHEYLGKTLTEAGCVTKGRREYVCSKCNHSYVEETEVLWHTSYGDGNCIRCEESIEKNLWYKLIDGKDEYQIIGVYDSTALNSHMIIESYFNDKPITEIAEEALIYVDVKSVAVPPTIVRIRDGAFKYSTVNEVDCFTRLISIGKEAFKDCRILSKIILYPSLMFIGSDAFAGCVSLKEVVFNGSREQFDKINIMDGNDYLLNATITFTED